MLLYWNISDMHPGWKMSSELRDERHEEKANLSNTKLEFVRVYSLCSE